MYLDNLSLTCILIYFFYFFGDIIRTLGKKNKIIKNKNKKLGGRKSQREREREREQWRS